MSGTYADDPPPWQCTFLPATYPNLNYAQWVACGLPCLSACVPTEPSKSPAHFFQIPCLSHSTTCACINGRGQHYRSARRGREGATEQEADAAEPGRELRQQEILSKSQETKMSSSTSGGATAEGPLVGWVGSWAAGGSMSASKPDAGSFPALTPARLQSWCAPAAPPAAR